MPRARWWRGLSADEYSWHAWRSPRAHRCRRCVRDLPDQRAPDPLAQDQGLAALRRAPPQECGAVRHALARSTRRRDRVLVAGAFPSLDEQRIVESRPIKGTRPRGASAEEDARLATELALLREGPRRERDDRRPRCRNDLGRVCRFGTVEAPEIFAVEPYATVHQLASRRCAASLPLRGGTIDLLRACFPPGSMTGAPKHRGDEHPRTSRAGRARRLLRRPRMDRSRDGRDGPAPSSSARSS